MILIISEPRDLSTNDVIDWLVYYGYKCIRFNKNTPLRVKKITIHPVQILLEVDGHMELDLAKVDAIWYRRGWLDFSGYFSFFKEILKKHPVGGVYKHLQSELNTLNDFIQFYIESKKKIGSMNRVHLNKLQALYFAIESGLEVPDTTIIDSKHSLELLLQSNEIITKSIQYNLSPNFESPYFFLTNEVSETDDRESFFPTLFQSKIEKKYELRVFFLSGKVYTVAIFSQNDTKTSIDYRNYNFEKPNRFVRFNLPKDIADKIIVFMDKVQLDTGSIDMIVSSDGKYYFLEVNPVGQYGGMVSIPGNYFLDREIAKQLIGYEECK